MNDDWPATTPTHPLVVVGHGGVRSVTASLGAIPGITARDSMPAPATNGDREAAHAAVTMFVTNLTETIPPAWRDRLARRDGLTLAVVAAPASGDSLDPTTARAAQWLRGSVDAMVVVEPDHHAHGIRQVTTTCHEIISRPGVINLDLADIGTVLGSGRVAAITTGATPETEDMAETAVSAVEEALSAPAVDIGDYTAVLVNLVAGDQLTVSSAVEAVDGIQASVPDDAHLIWGTAVDDSLSDVHAQVVAAGNDSPTFDAIVERASHPDPGPNNCPRCGGHIAVYSLGDRETRACEDCGFADTPGVDSRS
jgi:hypothetical protein